MASRNRNASRHGSEPMGRVFLSCSRVNFPPHPLCPPGGRAIARRVPLLARPLLARLLLAQLMLLGLGCLVAASAGCSQAPSDPGNRGPVAQGGNGSPDQSSSPELPPTSADPATPASAAPSVPPSLSPSPVSPSTVEPNGPPAGGPSLEPPAQLGRRPGTEPQETTDSRPPTVAAGTGQVPPTPVAGTQPPGAQLPESDLELPVIDPDKLFDGWGQPRFVLLVSGQQHGYIEPCGCTGLANQKGGLARRRRLQQELVEKGWTVIPIDAGNQVRRFGRQAEIKFQMTVEAMNTMKYRAVALGPDDLKLSTGELIAVTTGDDDQSSPFVCANVALVDRSLTPEFRVVEVQGRKIGITAVLGDDHLKSIQGDEVIRQPAEEGLALVWPKLEAEKCDMYVLLAHASLDQSRALAQRFPRFDLVVSAGGAGEPTRVPEPIPNSDAVMVQCGTKGMFAGVIGVFDDAKTPLRYQRVPLDNRFEDAQEMLQLLAAYQQQLETEGLERLGVRPLPHPSGRRFVGSEACAKCHADAYDIWKETPHAHATDSLVKPGERSEIARHFDPECLSCHVTGWNPQKFFPYESGFLSLQATPQHTGSGCENCHGPGDRHVAAESRRKDVARDELLKLREEMRLPLDSARQTCLQCHDLDNSPDFHAEGAFEEYWEQVAH